jgi:threonine/homoserine/homoserine lactone efflux protein
MSQHPIRQVENYTDAFLTTLGVFLFMAFWMIAAALGYAWVAVTAYGVDHIFKWIGRLKSS